MNIQNIHANIQGVLTNPSPARSRWVAAEDASPRAHGLSPRALQRALTFMEANLGKRLTLAEIAASAAVSRFHFARLFRVTTGHSPMEFLMRARIARSQSLLVRGDTSICAVAAALGFCDQSHFTRTFRRLIGVPPREYLRRTQAVGALN
ncbi:helix-turn-helix transcriptional regulator [Steroidobacter sp. S1-65]|uniref:Helix-turn-helix transcriptional regulator n=1 Tax=Steroidobacter gossypii TaxID=2805490 RepID=A0ABS1X0P9_9GAMM|nr:AraC family transcriptional regulator [Steroidobacter gossypii]MBM0106831.1 helix-turn-helix transcriptional regulator [Steroidobacter gossypii]